MDGSWKGFHWVFTIIGLVIGLSTEHIVGVIGGAVLGYLFATSIEHKRLVRELQSDLIQLWSELQSLKSKPPTPDPIPSAAEPSAPTTGPDPASSPPPPPSAETPVPATSTSTPPESREATGAKEPPHPPTTRPVDEQRVDLFDDWMQKIQPFLSGARLMVTLGVVVLFFGVVFLLKYAVDHGLLSIELRLIAAGVGGIAMTAFGFWTRKKKPAFGQTLQGGGVGVLYLTVFFAYRLYELLPATLTFFLLVSFVALSTVLAVLQNSRSLALLGTMGGFLAPVLASTGQGSHVALFSYYVVLNAGILAISWLKSWRSLNLTGFVFTFVLSGSWALRYYRPEYFSSTEPFLVAFFLMYVAIAVAFAVKHVKPEKIGLVDGTLVFGVPLATATFQAGIVADFEYGLAISSLALGAFYLALAGALFRTHGQSLRALCEAFLGEGVVFATLAVPFAFDGLVTSAFWALEGAAILWVGVRQDRIVPRLFGATLQVLAGFAFLLDPGKHGDLLIANPHFVGSTLVAIAAIASSLYLSRAREKLENFEQVGRWFFFGYGIIWWLGGGLHEIEVSFSENAAETTALLVFVSLTAWAAFLLGRRVSFRALERVSYGLLPSFLLGLAATSLSVGHPASGTVSLGWGLGIGTFYFLLRSMERDLPALARYWHAGGFALVALLVSWETSFRVDQLAEAAATWSNVVWGLVPAALVLLVFSKGRLVRWPIAENWATYTTYAAIPVATYLALWVLHIETTPGDPAPLPYIPLLNPIDLAVSFSLLALVSWQRRATTWFEENEDLAKLVQVAVAGLAFLALHGVIVRTVHHWTGVPFHDETLFRSGTVQASVAVLWAVTGLTSMVVGSRSRRRTLWTFGAALMGAVVFKLFVVDLSHTGTVARIVSFLGVGVLLLAVGYAAPVPPREREAEATS